MTILGRAMAYGRKVFGLEGLLDRVADGRRRPQIPMGVVVRSALGMQLNALGSLNALEQTKEKPFWKRWLGRALPSADTIGRGMGHVEAWAGLRQALHEFYACRKRNKSLGPYVGGLCALLIDGHEVSASRKRECPGCSRRKVKTTEGLVTEHYHRLVMGTLLCGKSRLPLDVELQRPGEDEVSAAQRLIERLLEAYPRAFDVIVLDGLYPREEVLRTALDRGKEVVIVLKNESLELLKDARGLFASERPVEVNEVARRSLWWDIEGFDHWVNFQTPLRVVRSLETTRRRRQADGRIERTRNDWVWMTSLSKAHASTETIVRLGHGRWSIENEGGFNTLVNQWHADHLYRHAPAAIEAFWLLVMIAFNLFHALLEQNLKPALRTRYTEKHFLEEIRCELYQVTLATDRPP